MRHLLSTTIHHRLVLGRIPSTRIFTGKSLKTEGKDLREAATVLKAILHAMLGECASFGCRAFLIQMDGSMET